MVPYPGKKTSEIYMNEVDNKYIESAITNLVASIGVKEFADDQKILSLVRSKKIKEAIKEIAKYLGIPIEVNLTYVPKGYRPSANDGFQSTHLVKTDKHGQGTGGITAQVSIPGNLPFFGTPAMINFPINVRLSENCAENPATLIAVMAHELSHIVLYSLWHKEKENEFYTDLTAMMLGFGDVMRNGRKVVKTDSVTDHGFLSSRTTTTTHTTTYGYLSDDNFNFAYNKIEKILKAYRANKNSFLKKIREDEKNVRKQKAELLYFRKYLGYLDRNLHQKISEQDGHWISTFHQYDYTDEFESTAKRAEAELKQLSIFTHNLKHYSEARTEDMKKYETKLRATTAELNSKYDRIRGAVMILKKYVSMPHRFQSFVKISLN